MSDERYVSIFNTTLLSTVTVTGNDSNAIGGGIALEMDTGSIATVVIEDSVIESNTAVKVGGLNADTVPALEIRDTDIRFNTSTASQGGVLLDDAPAVLERVVLEGNTGVTVGALQAQGYNRGSVTLIDVVAADNVLSVPGGNGYGIYLKGDATFGSVLERVQVALGEHERAPIVGRGPDRRGQGPGRQCHGDL